MNARAATASLSAASIWLIAMACVPGIPRVTGTEDSGPPVPTVSGCLSSRTLCFGTCSDLQSDPHNCGACNYECVRPPHTTGPVSCVSGACTSGTIRCVPGWHACEGYPDLYGCTGNFASRTSCGACGQRCPTAAGTLARCNDGACDSFCTTGGRACHSTCVALDDVGSCGASCAPCAPAPAHGSVACTGLACRAACDVGYAERDGVCVAVSLRPIAPASVSRTGTARPTFRWAKSSTIDSVTVHVASDAAGANEIATFDATGDHATAPSALPAGRAFWHVTARDTSGQRFTTPTWVFTVPPRDAGATAGEATGRDGLDADGDGLADLVLIDVEVPGRWMSFGGSATRQFAAAVTPGALPLPDDDTLPYALSPAGDVDGDGYGDLLATDGSRVVLVRGSSHGLQANATVIGYAPKADGASTGIVLLTPGDIDGDGYADVGWRAANVSHVLHGGADGVTTQAFADLAWLRPQSPLDANGDGYLDLIDVHDGTVRVHFGGPFTTLAAESVALTTDETTVVTGDFNGDGCSDAIVTRPDGVHRILYLGRPVGGWTDAADSASEFAFARPGSVLDVNGDGSDDVVTSDGNTLFGSHGMPVFTASGATGPVPVSVGDLDGDGRGDGYLPRQLVFGAMTGFESSVVTLAAAPSHAFIAH